MKKRRKKKKKKNVNQPLIVLYIYTQWAKYLALSKIRMRKQPLLISNVKKNSANIKNVYIFTECYFCLILLFIFNADCAPTEEERVVYDQVTAVLSGSSAILQSLYEYKGCDELIRQAITAPSPDTEDAAWQAVLPRVDEIARYYEYSKEIERVFPTLVIALCKSEDSPKESIAKQQATAKQFCDFIDFAIKFDEAKMAAPSIQNDFSFYRRNLSRMKMAKKDAGLKIKDDLANSLSLFFAYPTPMMKLLSETLAKVLSPEEVSRDGLTKILSIVANTCLDMHTKGLITNKDITIYMLRVMTGSIILFDHVNLAGAFYKKTPINVNNINIVIIIMFFYYLSFIIF